MAIKFQYNKTSLQQQQKQLKMRERTLPTIKSKESALRLEVKKARNEIDRLELQLEESIQGYHHLVALWDEFTPNLIEVTDVELTAKKVAGVLVPVLGNIEYRVRPFSLFNSPSWFAQGVEMLKQLATVGIEAEFVALKLEFLEHARRKTTQKVNLFEKVQIPGFKDAIRKIKRYLEDEESLSKSSQKIMRANLEIKALKVKELSV